DEIEKTCDAVAIVDQGRVVLQGSLDELRNGAEPSVRIAVDNGPRAQLLLAAQAAVTRVTDEDGELTVTLRDAAAVPDLNRRLVEAGLAVHRLEPTHASLEQRFLEITSRL